MSMEEARLDHLTLRIEVIERVLGAGDAEPAAGTVLDRLREAEADIGELEVAGSVRESDFTWATVRLLCEHRDAGRALNLSGPQVRAVADLIEGEWGKQ